MFIWQAPDWPRFRWDREALADALADARYEQGRLLGGMQALGFPVREAATLQVLSSDVLTSSAIEGESLDAHQVRSSLARKLGIDIGALAPVDRHVEGVVAMALDAVRHHDRPLTAARLQGWQAALFPTGRSGLTPVRTGAWRDDAKGPMQVVSGPSGRERVHFEAPPASRLDGEMAAFLAWFASPAALEPLLGAALAHLWFVTVHPFDDGNGRVARAIADMALARSEGETQRFYSMSAQVRLERAAYYDMLERTQRGTLDVTPWMAWFLGCFRRAVAGAEGLLAGVVAKASFWEAHAGQPFGPRQIEVLNRVLDGLDGKLTSSKWAKLASCSQDSAQRDIQDLVDRGILVRNPGGGRSTSYALAPSSKP